MRYLKRSILIAIVSMVFLPLSFFVYRYTDTIAAYEYNRFSTIHARQRVIYQYKKKLSRIAGQSSKIVPNTITTNIDYDIRLEGHNIKELYKKILYTYQGGLFFLVDAEIEAEPHSIRLAMKGFKVGGVPGEN
ncbi:MAG: hypothetical protein DRG37_01810 [Deltaproteobacteria bacterium]|nr:MAG: hypothetical protein DRG37_01810 [Deltaproteobacteria bacterium]